MTYHPERKTRNNPRFLFGLGRRLAYLAAVLFGISVVTFGLFALAPGDPAEIILRDRQEAPSADRIAELHRELGLDDPCRYVISAGWMAWLTATWVVHGAQAKKWPTSFWTGWVRPWSWPWPPWPSWCCFPRLWAFWVRFSGPRDRPPDQAGSILSISVPNFWLALLMITLFSLHWRWLPLMGRGGILHLIMPVITLGLAVAAMQGRVLRASLLEAIGQDYVRFAYAKGLNTNAVLKTPSFA